ncbi:MAG TPA: hypothetical protein VNO30_27820 [Kofleriaceae bacterium]|nr:hypothetical protein [Kofleriaceae bacterium]
MGYKTRGFEFAGAWYADDGANGSWLRDDLVFTALLDPLERDGQLAAVDRISVNLRDHEPINSVDELRARAREWGYDIVDLSAGDTDDPDLRIHIGLDPIGPRVFVAYAAERAPSHLRDLVAGWVAAWSAKLAVEHIHLTTASFEPTQDDYPRPTPPRVGLSWRLGLLDQYAGLYWHRQDPDRLAELERVQHALLPSGAHRRVDGDVLHIAFDADLFKSSSIAAARVAHERWLAPLVPTEPADGWNEEGDRRVDPSRPEDRDPFTLYDPEEQIGYKALVVQPGTYEVDEGAWAEARAVVAAGALPDGTPVRGVRLIFPRREDALLMHERVIASGFEMSLYPYDGVFWQVHPESSPMGGGTG